MGARTGVSMIRDSRVVCLVGARAGSKGVRNKNLRLLGGRPLLEHTVKQALAAELFAGVAVSSDSDAILECAEQAGATWLIRRPPEMATDECDKSDATVHCAQAVEALTGRHFEVFVDLDVTAPLRTPRHIREAVELLERTGAGNVFSVCPARRSPYFNMVELDSQGRPRLSKVPEQAVVRRQDAPATYDLNASIYVWRRQEFFDGHAAVYMDDSRVYVMPEETAFDVDSELDFRIVELLYPDVCSDAL